MSTMVAPRRNASSCNPLRRLAVSSAAARSCAPGSAAIILGTAVISIAMMVMTTSTSISVNPFGLRMPHRLSIHLHRQIINADDSAHYRHDDQCDDHTHRDGDGRHEQGQQAVQ